MEAERSAAIVEPLTRLALGREGLAAALRAIAAETTSRRLRRDLRTAASRIESGDQLAEALSSAHSFCPPQIAALLAAGAKANRLPEALVALGRHERRVAEISRQLRAVLLYPLLLFVSLATTTALLLLFVAPPIKATYRDTLGEFGVGMSLLAESGLERLDEYRWPLFAAWTLLVIGLSALALKRGLGWFGPLVRRLPLVGRVWRWVAWSQTLELWSLYLRAEVPLPEALQWSGEALGDPWLARRMRHWSRRLAEGQRLGQVLLDDPTTPPSVTALLAWGEADGATIEAIEAASDYARDRADSQLAFVAAAVPPLALFVLVVGIVCLYGLLLLPLALIRAIT